jgi:hypothetical protein
MRNNGHYCALSTVVRTTRLKKTTAPSGKNRVFDHLIKSSVYEIDEFS